MSFGSIDKFVAICVNLYTRVYTVQAFFANFACETGIKKVLHVNEGLFRPTSVFAVCALH